MQRAMCPKCGKLFTNKKGVKQHIVRMHVQKVKKSDSRFETVTLEEMPDAVPGPSLNIPEVPNEIPKEKVVNSTLSKPKPNSVLVESITVTKDSSKRDNLENQRFIDQFLDEVLERCMVNELVTSESNYQCGVCGKQFDGEGEANSHIVSHEVSKVTSHIEETNYQCYICGNLFGTNNAITDHMATDHDEHIDQTSDGINLEDEKDKIIAALSEKNGNLVKKNISLDKENRRIGLALAESIYETNEYKREIETQRESMSEIIKQNTLLNEEVRTTDEIIKMIKEMTEKPGDNSSDDDVTEIPIETQDIRNERSNKKKDENPKCNECKFSAKK